MTDDLFDPMKFIWDGVSEPSTSSPASPRVIKYRDRNDLEYLYKTGFVDTDKFTLKEWVESFKDSLQPNGDYILTESQWMKKGRYRYDGPIDAPFDPMEMREGSWNTQDLQKLVQEKLLPSLEVEEEFLTKSIFGEKPPPVDRGLVMITHPFKINLQHLLTQRPTPRRLRELSLAQVKSKSDASPSQAKTPLPQGSSFSQGPSSSQTTMDRLSKLLSKK